MATPLLFTPSFRHQRLGWLFISIVATMVYIATFAMAAEAALSSISLTRNEGVANHLTVEIPAVGDETSTPQPDRVKQAIAVLRAAPDITNVRPVSDAETEKLLQPWLSDPDLVKKLPLPVLIDIERKPGGKVTSSAIEDEVRTVVPDARVDDHAVWLADLAHLVRSLATLAAFMIGLTGVTLVFAIGLICRAVMATERDTVELLHIMGASDNSIARHFQSHAWRLAGPAAAAGFLFALASLGLLFFVIRHVIDLSTLQPGRWLALAILLIFIPLAAVIAAAVSARFSVRHLLQSFP